MTPLPPPLVLALLAFLAGLLPALRYAPDPLLLLAVTPLALGAAFLAPRLVRAAAGSAARVPLLLLAFAAAGAALGATAAREVAADCRAALPDGRRMRVEGVLHAGIARGADGDGAERVFLPLQMGVAGCEAIVRVRLAEAPFEAPAGSVVRVAGEWVRQGGGVVPSAWPRDPLYSGFLTADSVALVSPPRAAAHPLLFARGRAEEALHRLFPRHDALAQALLLNRRERIDPALRDRFARSGLAHLLAISGAHVALLAGAMMLLGSAARLPRARVAALTVAGTFAYLGVIGAPSSAVRSGIMLTLALLAVLLQRPSAALPVVSAAALAILAFTPTAVLDPGFQLSFAGRVVLA